MSHEVQQCCTVKNRWLPISGKMSEFAVECYQMLQSNTPVAIRENVMTPTKRVLMASCYRWIPIDKLDVVGQSFDGFVSVCSVCCCLSGAEITGWDVCRSPAVTGFPDTSIKKWQVRCIVSTNVKDKHYQHIDNSAGLKTFHFVEVVRSLSRDHWSLYREHSRLRKYSALDGHCNKQ